MLARRTYVAVALALVVGILFDPILLVAQDKKSPVEGQLLGVRKIAEYRELALYPSDPLGFVLNNLTKQLDEYLVLVQVRGNTCAGRLVVPALLQNRRNSPRDWSAPSRVFVRFKNRSKKRAWMYVRGPNGRELRTELVSVIEIGRAHV